MELQRLLGGLSERAKTTVTRARRRAGRGSLPLIASEVMTRDVRSCRVEDTLAQPATIMWERDCGSVPVLDGSQRLVGMITDRDICMAALTQGQPLQAIAVSTAMSGRVFAARPEDGVDVVEALMGQYQVRRVPVVDEGHLVGIISIGDLLRRIGDGSANGRSSAHAAREKLLHTLSAISQPRPS